MCELLNCYRTCIYLELFKKLWIPLPRVVSGSYKDKLGTGHVSHTPDILNLSVKRGAVGGLRPSSTLETELASGLICRLLPGMYPERESAARGRVFPSLQASRGGEPPSDAFLLEQCKGKPKEPGRIFSPDLLW